MGKRRIVILGGGVGAMTTAFELTNWDGWQEAYEIDVYQMGWRLGGKGASGRRHELGDRIEEHGLHVWMGFYENAFHVIRQVYDECARLNLMPNSPFKSWQDAFSRLDYASNMEHTPNGWAPWTIHFPPNDTLPGEQALFDRHEPPPTLWDLFVIALEWLARRVEELEGRLDTHPGPFHLEAIFAKLAIAIEERSSALLFKLVEHLRTNRIVTLSADIIDALLGLIEHVIGPVLEEAAKLFHLDAELRHVFYLVDAGAAGARGMIVDDVLGKGLGVLDSIDLMDWLKKHGCRQPSNPFVLAGYDALFAYDKGDPSKPNIAASTSIYGVMRMMFTYRGSMFWRMCAGMGDTIFSPMYLALRARGVRFHFFHRATRVGLDDSGAVGTIEFDLQATLKDPNTGYQPLYDVAGVPCWPSEPFYDQLVQGDELRRFNLESDYTEWHGRLGTVRLTRGNDFDDVVLAIPPGAAKWICGELSGRRPDWASMFDRVATVQTQAMQLWLNKTSADLGFPQPPNGQKPAVTAYVEPHDTWADMSHLLDKETWTPADNVQSIAYFCNAFQDAAVIPPPFTAPDFPAQSLARVRQMAIKFLNTDVQTLWPQCGQPFDWDLLVRRTKVTGEAALDTQYLRANVDGTERYVLSLAGSAPFRLHPGNTGIENLFIAGDWTFNVVNAGCVEAGVISGRLASQAMCGRPAHIYGAFGGDDPGVK